MVFGAGVIAGASAHNRGRGHSRHCTGTIARTPPLAPTHTGGGGASGRPPPSPAHQLPPANDDIISQRLSDQSQAGPYIWENATYWA